jgi:type I site-specific restriction endonuclease
MPLNEAETRAKLIDPAIHKRGWTEDLIRREETGGVPAGESTTPCGSKST